MKNSNTLVKAVFWVNLQLLTSLIFTPLSFAAEAPKKYPEVEWTELMPADDLEALLNPPAHLNDIADGSAADTLNNLDKLKNQNQDKKASRYYQALNSTRVITAFDNKPIKIPGFVVPLLTNDERRITEFFIVPYFGACIHLPPPPPNQIIFAKINEGIKPNSLHDPFLFSGNLSIKNIEHELANAAYQLDIDLVETYQE